MKTESSNYERKRTVMKRRLQTLVQTMNKDELATAGREYILGRDYDFDNPIVKILINRKVHRE